MRGHDVVARCGGDEFTILAVSTATAACESVVTRLVATLATVDVSASMGAAALSDCTSLDDAWQVADRKMFAAKASRTPST